MDKNELIGLFLISIMLIAYAHFFVPIPTKEPAHTTIGQHVASADEVDLRQEQRLDTASSIAVGHCDTTLPTEQSIEKEVLLENEVIRVVLSSKGGRIKKVTLKNYRDHQQQPLVLLDEQSSMMELQYAMRNVQQHVSTSFFNTEAQNQHVVDASVATAVFTLQIAPGQYIKHTFTLPGKGYVLSHAWEVVGLDEPENRAHQFVWHNRIRRVEEDIQACRNKTTINYYSDAGKFKHLKETANKRQEQALPLPIRWVGIKQRFFTSGIIAETPFAHGHIAMTPTPQSAVTVKEAEVRLSLPVTEVAKGQHGLLTFYFGPNDYRMLDQVTPGFAKNVSLGWPVVRWLNRYLIMPIFGFLERYISNYGIIIVLLVVFIKSLLLPLSYGSYISMAKMRVIKPAVNALRAQYGENTQKLQMEQMKLYKEMGINPLSGCVPVLLQMPILLAMFNFFPNAIALRQQSFLWASDLSTYDSIVSLPFSIPAYGSHVSLFTLLMTVSTLLHTWSNEQLSPTQETPMKMMAYLMPITFMFVLNSFPSGLSFYYFVSNIITLVQQRLTKRFVNEARIRRKLDANQLKNKNQKPSRFQDRLAEIMKLNKRKQTTDSE